MDGTSTTIDECEKIWLLFPGTTRNLSLMKGEDGLQAKLARIGGLLEGGAIVRTTSSDALYIPAGCIHAVFTIRGGFLAAVECTTARSV